MSRKKEGGGAAQTARGPQERQERQDREQRQPETRGNGEGGESR